MNETLWIENPMIFIKDKGYLDFIPSRTTSKLKQINSLTLMLIYLFIILYLFKLNNSITNTLIFGIIFIMVVLYYGYYSYKENLDVSENENNISIESGYYDSNGELQLGPFYSHKKNNLPRLDKSYKEIKSYLNDSSRKPTPDNPFMNPILTDYNNESDPRPANVDDDEIKNEIRQSFNKDLFRDLSDLFDVKNAERIFYTVPGGSIPNDQDAFAKWCYGHPATCHEDTMSCEKNIYEDLRYRNNYR
jgi:Ca2+/Na+ antiporter